MPIQKISTEKLIANATYLFRTRGYHNTSIADIANICNLSKASIYHHTTSKLDLAMTVLKQAHQHAEQHFFALLRQPDLPAAERLQQYANAYLAYYENIEGGCLFGNFALEISGQYKELDSHIKAFFNDWTKALAVVLKTAYAETEATTLASQRIAEIEGATMLMRLDDNIDHLKYALTSLVNLLNSAKSNAEKTCAVDNVS